MRTRRLRAEEIYRDELGPFIEGMDEVTAAHLMPTKRLRKAVNVFFDDKIGACLKRFGKQQISTFPTANPPRDAFVLTRSDGTEYLLVSDGVSLYVTTDLTTYTLLITGLDSDGFLEFEIAENKVWITNGIDYVMSYDGTDLIVYDREAEGTVEAGSSATQIVDSARTEADDYWNKRKIVITSGTYAGVLYGTVTDFVQSTNTMTISGFGGQAPDVGSTYKVGLIMPRGSVIRYLKGRLFLGATPENLSEIRFSEIADPDTGEFINIDNPRAFPPQNQIAVAQHDGDRIWTFSPVLDDVFLVSKKSSVYRIDEDQIFLFAPKLIENFVGSVFPNSWQVKKGLLVFLGTEKSGYVDFYVSDLVRVKPLYTDGRMKLSFSEIRQAVPIRKYITKATTEQFNTGDISDTCDTTSGVLKPKNFNFTSFWNEVLKAKSNVAVGDNEGNVNIKAQPEWTLKYDGDVLPENASPSWQVLTDGALIKSVLSGIYIIKDQVDAVRQKVHEFKLNNIFDSTKNVLVNTKFKNQILPLFPSPQFFNNVCRSIVSVSTGSYKVELEIYKELTLKTTADVLVNGILVGQINRNTFFEWAILVKPDGTYKIWKDGVLFNSGTANTTVNNILSLQHRSTISTFGQIGGNASTEFDWAYFQNIIDTDIPDTLPQSGTIDIVLDYTRTPDGFGKFYYEATLNGGTVTIQSASSDDDIIYSSLQSLSNGQEPGVDNSTPVKRYLKVRFTLTSIGIALGPVITNFLAGFLWRSKALQIGQNISDWKNFLSNITTPTGTFLVTKIRLAKTITTPQESDFGAWQVIVDGNDIGTILSDTSLPPPPSESRWVDVKVEGNPSASGLSPQLDNFTLNWVEGAVESIPVRSIIFENRYYLIAAQATTGFNDRVFMLDKNNGWYIFEGWNLNTMVAFSGLILGMASDSNKIFQHFIENKYDDDGVAIDSYIDLPEIDFGPSRFSLWELMIENASQSTLKVYVKKQGDSVWTFLGNLDFTKHNTQKIRAPFGTITKQLSIRIQNNTIGENVDVRVVGYRGIGMPEDYN